ncbi:MAG: hypothetical protein V3T28_06940, partial [Gemmatimonadales bacterium]
TISTADKDLGYTSPPGVIDEASRQGVAFEFTSQEINERSLRLIARDLRPGERAEAFRRFSNQADKNFLQYRTLRAWARGRGPGWESGDLEFFLKVGSDEHNFYMYRVPARTVDWEPEVVVEIDRWLRLRTDAERDWLSGAPPSGSEFCGGDSTAFVRCDGPYLVQIKDPAVRPPNLARVSEIAVGMLRVGQAAAIPEAELWVDDIRLSDVVGDAGVAGYFEARLTAADFADVEFSYSSTDDRFRQIDEAPDYLSDTQTRIGSTVRLDKLLPESWGMSVPFSVQHQRVSTDPFFVRGTDVLAEALDGLRKPASAATSYQVALRRSRRGDSFAERLLLDPLALSASRLDAENVSELSSAKTSNRQVRAAYDNRPAPQTIRGAPAFFVKFVDGLPGWISNSEFGRALRSSRLRWNPYQIRLSSELVDNLTDRLTFRVPVALPQDSALVPLRSVVHSWRNTVGADVRPFSSLGLRVDYMSTRDLRDYGDSTLVGRLTGEERGTLFGKDIGFEREQTLSTRLTASPVVNSWFRPRFSASSNFVFHRDPNGRVAVQVDIDSVTIFRIPEAVSNFRQRLLGSTLDLRRLAEVLGGPASTAARIFRGLFPADVSFLRERRSTFDRITFVPDLRYRLALGNTDEFREQDGDLALSAVERGVWTVAGGTRLPLGFGLRFDYRRTESTTWARRGESQSEITQRFERWPSGSVSWVYTPPPFLRGALSSVSAQARYRRTVGSSFQPAALQAPGSDSQGEANGITGIFAENRATNVTPTITLTWVAGVVTTGQFSRIRSEVLTSGNLTLNDQRSWGGSVNFSFRAPTTVFRLPSDVRTSLTVNATDATLCQKRAESPECAIVSDSRRRQVNIRLDTGFPPSMRGGASFSYVLTEERHTSSKVSQMVFTIFLDINFLASQVRR